MKKDDSVYLRHIIDAFMQIEHYIDGVSHEEFFSNKLLQDGVIRQLEVMGEAARNISEDLEAG
jgi:uncharacterized protein with HEPN domain